MPAKEGAVFASGIKLWLMASLMIVSTALFIIGVMIERNEGEGREVSAAHSETQDESPAEKKGEAQAEENGEAQSEEISEAREEAGEASSAEADELRSETLFGIELESPWLVGAVAVGSLALAAALLRFGQPVLIVVIPVAVVMTILDMMEVFRQMGEANMRIATLAVVVGLTHAAIAILAILALREWRTSTSSHRPAP